MKKYKIFVDPKHCLGDRWCCEIAPDTFDLEDGGRVVVTDEDGDRPEYVLKAAMACPNDCIVIIDAQTDETLWPRGH